MAIDIFERGIGYIFSSYKLHINNLLVAEREIIGNGLDKAKSLDKTILAYNKAQFGLTFDNVFKSYNANIKEVIRLLDNEDTIHNIEGLSFLRAMYFTKMGAMRSVSSSRKRIKHIYDRVLTYKEFTFILKMYNSEFSKKIILGYQDFWIGQGLGGIIIKRLNNDLVKSRCIDWGTTMALKAKLLEDGIELYSENNPNGTKYVVTHGSHQYDCFFSWINRKYVKQTHVFRPTSYRPTSYFAEDGSMLTTAQLIARTKTEDILHLRIGNVEKIMNICKRDLTYNKRFKDKIKQ